MIRLVLALSVPVLVAVGGLQPSGSSTAQNGLTAQEQTAGWTLLFDGRTTNGWRGFGQKAFPAAGWVVEDGTLKSLGQKGGDIVTTSMYGDFEFAWEWRLSPQGNSGVKYFVDETRGDAGGAIGHEYQTIDDDNYTAMALSVRQKTGAWYDVLPPTRAAARPVGEWNRSRLVVNGQIIEHWLNDTLVLRYDITSSEAAAGVATSKFKERGALRRQDPHANPAPGPQHRGLVSQFEDTGAASSFQLPASRSMNPGTENPEP